MTTNGWKRHNLSMLVLIILLLQSKVTMEDGHSGEQHGPQSMSQSRFQTNFDQSSEGESTSDESDEDSNEEEEEGSDEVGVIFSLRH